MAAGTNLSTHFPPGIFSHVFDDGEVLRRRWDATIPPRVIISVTCGRLARFSRGTMRKPAGKKGWNSCRIGKRRRAPWSILRRSRLESRLGANVRSTWGGCVMEVLAPIVRISSVLPTMGREGSRFHVQFTTCLNQPSPSGWNLLLNRPKRDIVASVLEVLRTGPAETEWSSLHPLSFPRLTSPARSHLLVALVPLVSFFSSSPPLPCPPLPSPPLSLSSLRAARYCL